MRAFLFPNRTSKIMMEDRRSWIEDVTERHLLVFQSKIQNQQSSIGNLFLFCRPLTFLISWPTTSLLEQQPSAGFARHREVDLAVAIEIGVADEETGTHAFGNQVAGE